LAVFALVFVVVHRMYADVIESTEGRHRFVGYAKIYFKKWGFVTSIFTTAIGFTLTLVAYIALAGDFIRLIVPGLPGGYAPYVFWAIGSLAVVLSLKRLANLEFSITAAIGLIVLALFVAGIFFGDAPNIQRVDFSKAFLPYGVVLFALAGRAAISSIVDYYENKKLSKEKMIRSISLGTIAPAVIYLFFVLAVLFLSGDGVSPDSLSGLSSAPYPLLFLAGILGVFALLTSYFFLSIEVGDIFRYDFKFNKFLAIAAVIILPIWLYSAGFSNFIWLIALVGGVFLAMDSIMTIAMYSKIKGWKLSAIILVVLFAAGAVFEAMSLL